MNSISRTVSWRKVYIIICCRRAIEFDSYSQLFSDYLLFALTRLAFKNGIALSGHKFSDLRSNRGLICPNENMHPTDTRLELRARRGETTCTGANLGAPTRAPLNARYRRPRLIARRATRLDPLRLRLAQASPCPLRRLQSISESTTPRSDKENSSMAWRTIQRQPTIAPILHP